MSKGTNLFYFLSLFVFCHVSFAEVSAVRHPQYSWKQYASHYQKKMQSKAFSWFSNQSVMDAARPYAKVDWEKIAPEATRLEIETAFYFVRDKRYLNAADGDQFLRRISWLYPDDGCFARASLMTELLREDYFTGYRIFVFGDLYTLTPNHPNGSVSWWFHTAPLVKSEEGDLYVLDPAVDSLKPLLVEDWVAAIGLLSDVEVSICSANSYDPRGACESETDSSAQAHRDISPFLRREWKRQEQLKRDPSEVLGDKPPWLEENTQTWGEESSYFLRAR